MTFYAALWLDTLALQGSGVPSGSQYSEEQSWQKQKLTYGILWHMVHGLLLRSLAQELVQAVLVHWSLGAGECCAL